MLLNMSVAKRLSGGIGIVVLSLVALTMFVMSAFKDEHITTDLIHTNYVPGTSTLYSADRDLQQALVAERTMHATRPGTEEFSRLLTEHAENVQQARDRVDKFYKLLPDEELTRLMGEYVKLRDQWEASTTEIVRLAQSNNGADRDQALKLSIGVGAEKFEAMRGVLDQMQDRLEAMLSEKYTTAK